MRPGCERLRIPGHAAVCPGHPAEKSGSYCSPKLVKRAPKQRSRFRIRPNHRSRHTSVLRVQPSRGESRTPKTSEQREIGDSFQLLFPSRAERTVSRPRLSAIRRLRSAPRGGGPAHARRSHPDTDRLDYHPVSRGTSRPAQDARLELEDERCREIAGLRLQRRRRR